ncbi:MAG: penicillin acylase family protein [Proteobacteria bacterium]|nr:penicillin acylase family protein [Pseudomonadota bacterium]MCP4915851.1 penicillin acylase family protein [Pseudomonadota bacterium]
MLLLLLSACIGGVRPTTILDTVPETERYVLHGLECRAQVVRTELDVPHVYAESREDASRVLGFVTAKDRYFEMELARRLGIGEVSGLLGDAALETDIEARGQGSKHVADTVFANLTSEQERNMAAFAEGVNDYIAMVALEQIPPPSELDFAVVLLGGEKPVDLMVAWTSYDVAAVGATIIYNLGYETGDVGRAHTESVLPGLFDGAALGELRQAGVYDDIWRPVAPPMPYASAPGWGLNEGYRSRQKTDRERVIDAPASMLERAADRLADKQRRMGHDWDMGFGSNVWGVDGAHSADGRALLASDGHLALDIPSLFYQFGIDTKLLGGGDTMQVGTSIPGFGQLAVGTNGHIAWSQTQLMGDITDWYLEEVQLDGDGKPSATWFEGEWRPLIAHDEVYEVADVSALGSTGRTETWTRWETFDGRWIAEIEGDSVGADEAVVTMQGDWIIPGDTDGDGVVSALSFDYTGLDDANILLASDRFGHAETVDEFREATRGLVAYSQNLIASDSAGDIYFTGYQAVPCRNNLERDEDGLWGEASDPSQLLDGTRYGGFTVEIDADGYAVEGEGDKCLVPFDEYPAAKNPESGYLLNANNDPGNISLDDSLTNDPYYIGGSWIEGYRAVRIDELLAEDVAVGSTIESMSEMQGDTRSALGAQFSPVLVEAIVYAQTLASIDRLLTADEQRVVDLYLTDADALDEVRDRLEGWADDDFPTPTGVETFYSTATEDEQFQAVATMLHNAWMGRYVAFVFNDEGMPDVWEPTGGTGQTRALTKIVDGRGPDNPEGLSSWNEDTEESAFFDVLGTDEVETSHEIALMAMLDALVFLRSPAEDDSEGGFGTEDMSEWIWGYKHVVRMESVLAGFLGDDPTYSVITEQFSVTTDTLPLAEGMAPTDPRAELVGFPRPGDTFAIDAANNGFNTTDFDYGSGPVFRMVVAVGGPDDTEGVNIIPGGQSGLSDDEHFADQAALWLANDTVPLRLSPEQVVEGAEGREIYVPGTGGNLCGF